MQNPKPSRSGSSEVTQKVSPRAARPLKLSSPEPTTSSSGPGNGTPKDRSPKVKDRKSPRSPIAERKRPSNVAGLESQISKLQDDLKKVKDQLFASESSKKGAQANAEEVQKELFVVSMKLEECQKNLSELIFSKEAHVLDLRSISEEKDEAWKSQLEVVKKQQSVDLAALASAHDEIQKLKLQLEMVAGSDDARSKSRETTDAEIECLREKLAETHTLLEITWSELVSCKESEAQAQEMAREVFLQLEAARDTAEALRLDAIKATEAYNCITSELDHSRSLRSSLEGLVENLRSDLAQQSQDNTSNAVDQIYVDGVVGNQDKLDNEHLGSELDDVKCEVARLKSAVEAAEIRYQEEQTRGSEQIISAQAQVEQIKSLSNTRVAELEEELNKTKADIEELGASLLEKETELQGTTEKNRGLNIKPEESASQKERGHELEKELTDLREEVAQLKASLMDKETEFQNISEENEMLKVEVRKKEADSCTRKDVIPIEVESFCGAEREALGKLSQVMEEADKSNKKVATVTEQLEAAQAVNAEMESELMRLKVQSDQWRKAAEAAASMLSAGSNGKFAERTGSLGSNFGLIPGRITSPFVDDYDGESPKKKNGGVLRKFGVLWKKPQK